MVRKIVLSLAMSLDGFIATKTGGFEWIAGDGDKTLDTKNKWDYSKFLESVDIIVMGKNSYDQGFSKDFSNKEVYVATTEKTENKDNLHFINGDIVELVKNVKSKTNKNIFIFGGGGLVHNFLKSNAIDEYYVGIVPVILGDGVSLFQGINPTIKLHLVEIMSENGIVVLKYNKR